MVQIIQSQPTQRQSALELALGQAAQNFGSGYLQGQQTKRQQALADQQMALQLNAQGIDASPQDLRDYAAGTYQPKVITPAQEAQPAQYGKELQGPVMPGQDPLREVFSRAKEATPAVMGNANPLMNYTETKKAQLARDIASANLKKEETQAGIENKKADTGKKNAEKTYYETYKPQLAESQIEKNNKYVPGGGLSANQSENNIFKESRLLNQSAKPYKTQLDAADKIEALANDQLGGGARPNESRAQRIARYDQADSRQVAEIVKAMDKMLSGAGASTVSGQEHLTPITFEGLAQKFGEKITGDPRGVRQGEFVERMLESVGIEKKVNQQKLDEVTSGSEARLAGLKKSDPERFKQLIRGYNPNYGKEVSGGHGQQSIPIAPTSDHLKTVQGMTREQKLALINGTN